MRVHEERAAIARFGLAIAQVQVPQADSTCKVEIVGRVHYMKRGCPYSRRGVLLHRQLDALYNRALLLGADLLSPLKRNER